MLKYVVFTVPISEEPHVPSRRSMPVRKGSIWIGTGHLNWNHSLVSGDISIARML
jgi:hypothetical protein